MIVKSSQSCVSSFLRVSFSEPRHPQYPRGTMGDGVLMEARFLVTVGGRRTGPATVQLVQGFILVQQCG